jgi:PAS domain S-box-containing protein
VECNAAFEALTGYERDEIIGRNCRFLRGPGTEPDLTAELRAGIREGRPVLVEIINYKKDGTPFRNAVMVAPIFDAQGELEYFLGSQVDVSKAADLEAGNTAGAARAQAARDAVALLSPRQREILVHMAAGKLNKQIAYELGLSERTVKMHRSSVIRTLGVRTSVDAIRVAVEAGL